MNWCL